MHFLNLLAIFSSFYSIQIQYKHMEKGQKLSEERIAEFKQTFQLFDKDHDGFISTKELSVLLRSLNQTPTENELADWIKIIDKGNKGKFNLSDFLALMANEYREPQAESELIQAMQSIFKPKGTSITIKQFRNVMSNLGQKLSEDELNQLFKQLKMDKQQNFNYEQFIKTILTR